MHPTLLSSFNKPFLTRQSFFFRFKFHHHRAHLWWMIQLPKLEMEEPKISLYQRKFRQGLKKSLPGCKRMLEIKLEMLIISRKCLNPSAKSSLKKSKLHWSPSLVWTFIMWQ
jgi:hypothetical protein